MSPSKSWWMRDQSLRVVLPQVRDGLLPGHDNGLGHGEEDFLAHQLAQIRRRTADAEIHQLGQGVELRARSGWDGVSFMESPPFAPRRSSESRPGRFRSRVWAERWRPRPRVRLITSIWRLAETTATLILGSSARELCRQRHSVLAGHVEIDEHDLGRELHGLLQRFGGVGRLYSLPVADAACSAPWPRTSGRACCHRRSIPCTSPKFLRSTRSSAHAARSIVDSRRHPVSEMGIGRGAAQLGPAPPSGLEPLPYGRPAFPPVDGRARVGEQKLQQRLGISARTGADELDGAVRRPLGPSLEHLRDIEHQ